VQGTSRESRWEIQGSWANSARRQCLTGGTGGVTGSTGRRLFSLLQTGRWYRWGLGGGSGGRLAVALTGGTGYFQFATGSIPEDQRWCFRVVPVDAGSEAGGDQGEVGVTGGTGGTELAPSSRLDVANPSEPSAPACAASLEL